MQKGIYCPGEEGECVIFHINENPKKGGCIFYFTTPVRDIARLFEYTDPYYEGEFLHVTTESYNNFVNNVIDKNVPWNGVVNGMSDMGNHDAQNIPGRWFSTPQKRTSLANRGYKKPTFGLPLAGSSRKSRRIHRKPTKRRRNRRGNRKTKKN